MTIKLRQSTASQELPLGYFLDSTDGDTPETALTIANTDIKIWKTGATTLADKNSGGATHIAGGIYYTTLDATDTNTLGPMVIFVKVAGALAVRLECEVLAANVYDSLIAGSDQLQVDVTQFGGTNATATGGRPEVNTTHAAGTAWGSGAITAGVIATDAIGAAELAADAVTEIVTGVWAAAARTLTALDEDSTTLDLDNTIRAAVGLSSANLDTQLSTIDTVVDSILADTAAMDSRLPSDPADASDIASAFGTVNSTLGTIAGYIDTEVGAIKSVTDKLDDTLEDSGGGVWIFTEAALANAPAGGGGGGDATEAKQDIIIAALAVVDGNVDGLVTAVADLPTNSELSTALASSDDAVMARLGAPVGASLSADLAAVKSDTAAILLDTGTDGVVVAAGSKEGYRLSSTGVDDILDESVETGATVRQSLRLSNAALGGKASGLETTEATFRDLADTKDRLVATVDDNGNRTAVTRDLT